MAWLRIDDRVRTHPKVVKAGPAAAWLWFCGICYCREHLTDGLIPKVMLNTLAPGLSSVKRCVKKLIEVGLWYDRDDSYEVHDFLDWNPAREDVEADREWDRRRKELYTDHALVAAIRARDGDTCQYCGKQVNWRDRRGPIGGQFDHVNPRGENSLENVVVACRGCNIRKNNKTPDQAGMPLRRSQIQSSPESSSGTKSESSPESSSTSRDHAIASARDPAIAGGLGSLLESGSSLQEGSLKETKPGPLLARGATVAFDAQQQREHAGCFPEHCHWRTGSVRVCFPASFVGRFSRLAPAANDANPAAWVLAWVRRTEADPAYTPSNADKFAHWQACWSAAYGDTTKSTATTRTKAALQRFVDRGTA